MTTNFQPDPRDVSTDLDALEDRNRDRISGWWDLLGLDPEYPAATDTVVKLLRAVEYAVDPDWVLAAISGGWIPPVGRIAGRLSWHATDVVSLSCAAEARRKWIPHSKIHGHKQTLAERLHDLCLAEGQSAFKDLDQFDFEGLLGLLVQVSGDRGAVECLAAALREKLRLEGVLS